MNEIEILKKKISIIELPQVKVEVGVVNFDLNEFKKQLDNLLEETKKHDLNVNNKEEFYNLRAKLNNFSKEVNENKKLIKKTYCEPYLDFENQTKECIKVIDNASKYVDEQIKIFEAQEKQILKDEFIEMWKNVGHPLVPFERIENQNWYLKKTSKKQVLVEMQQLQQKIDADCDLILRSVEFDEEAEGVIKQYLFSLNVAEELGKYTQYKNIIKQRKEKAIEELKEETVLKVKSESLNEHVLNQQIKENEEKHQFMITFEASDEVMNELDQVFKKYCIAYYCNRK